MDTICWDFNAKPENLSNSPQGKSCHPIRVAVVGKPIFNSDSPLSPPLWSFLSVSLWCLKWILMTWNVCHTCWQETPRSFEACLSADSKRGTCCSHVSDSRQATAWQKKNPFSVLHLFSLASSTYVEITRLSDKSQSRPFAMHKLYRKKGIFLYVLWQSWKALCGGYVKTSKLSL